MSLLHAAPLAILQLAGVGLLCSSLISSGFLPGSWTCTITITAAQAKLPTARVLLELLPASPAPSWHSIAEQLTCKHCRRPLHSWLQATKILCSLLAWSCAPALNYRPFDEPLRTAHYPWCLVTALWLSAEHLRQGRAIWSCAASPVSVADMLNIPCVRVAIILSQMLYCWPQASQSTILAVTA